MQGDPKELKISELRAVMEKFGSPLFIVSEDILRVRYRLLQNALSENYGNGTIAYSFKTNYLSRICATLKEEGALAEVVSGFEYALARKLGFPGNQIVFNGPYKTYEDLETAAREGAIINVDCREELQKLQSIAEKNSLAEIPIGVRLSSSVVAEHLRTAYKRKALFERFGFNIESGDAAGFCADVRNSKGPLRIVGYHMHVATDVGEPDVFARAAKTIVSFARRMYDDLGIVPEYIDMGGGFADPNVRWFGSNAAMPPVGEFVRAIGREIEREAFEKKPRLFLEPGRFIVSSAASLVTKVVSVKHLNEKQIVTVDASESMIPTGLMNRHGIYAPEKDAPHVESVVAGPSCMAREVFGNYRLPPLREGDVLVVKNCGAYTIANSSQFIFPRPAIAWLDSKGNVSLARRAETYDDPVRLDIT